MSFRTKLKACCCVEQATRCLTRQVQDRQQLRAQVRQQQPLGSLSTPHVVVGLPDQLLLIWHVCMTMTAAAHINDCCQLAVAITQIISCMQRTPATSASCHVSVLPGQRPARSAPTWEVVHQVQVPHLLQSNDGGKCTARVSQRMQQNWATWAAAVMARSCSSCQSQEATPAAGSQQEREQNKQQHAAAEEEEAAGVAQQQRQQGGSSSANGTSSSGEQQRQAATASGSNNNSSGPQPAAIPPPPSACTVALLLLITLKQTHQQPVLCARSSMQPW